MPGIAFGFDCVVGDLFQVGFEACVPVALAWVGFVDGGQEDEAGDSISCTPIGVRNESSDAFHGLRIIAADRVDAHPWLQSVAPAGA